MNRPRPLTNVQVRIIMAFAVAALIILSPVSLVAQQENPEAQTTPKRITDSRITSAVQAELGRDDFVRAFLIRVQTADGIVTLSGSVENLLAKQRAAEIAKTAAGVRDVVNDIAVVPLAQTDDDIKKNVMEALRHEATFKPEKVQVTVKDSVVGLTGFVDSGREKYMLDDIVEGVKGVKAIEDTLVVKPEKSRPDDEIRKEIQAILQFDVWVDASFVDVKVKDGKVTLIGMVGSAAEKERAERDAWVSGVKSVDIDQLEVSRFRRNEEERKSNIAPAPTDADVTQAVDLALSYDPHISPNTITANAHDGVVTLTGVVDSLKVKQRVEAEALDISGVSRVNNNLVVRPSEEISDSEMQKRVEAALARSPFLDQAPIRVTADNGTISLTGTVGSFFQILRAVDLAASVSGVQRVSNKLKVKESGGPASPAQPEQ